MQIPGIVQSLFLTRVCHQKIYSVFKLPQYSTLHSLSSTHHSDAKPRFTLCPNYCTLNPHNEVLMTNSDLMILMLIASIRFLFRSM